MRNQHLHKNARRLRREMTEAERHLWRHLRLRQMEGTKFRRQYVIEPYIVDFACINHKLIIELDGSQHLENPADLKRDAYLASKGWRILRFWNDQVLKETDLVMEKIWTILGARP